jgi:hypothetical protein
MSRLTFAALWLTVLAGAAGAQQVPGRDLFEFPLGLTAEAAPLSTQMIGSLWNPAASVLHGADRAMIGFAGLNTPQDQGVRADMIAGAFRLPDEITGSLSFAETSVADILQTETDPQTLGGEIPYGSMLVSAGAATTRGPVSFGLAARYRWGTLDQSSAGAFALDAGAIVDDVLGTPVRVALSTFLFSPSPAQSEPTYMAAADAPLMKRDSTFALRAGYSYSQTDQRGHEGYLFTTATYGCLDASGGLARTTSFGNSSQRLRLGLALNYARYTVAIGREDGAAGFGATYQFLLTAKYR